VCREPPIDPALGCMPWSFPGGHRLGQGKPVRHASVQTLGRSHAAFGLSPSEPTALLRGVVYLQTRSEPPRLSGGKGFIQGCRLVGSELVHNQHHFLGVRIRRIDQLPQHMSEVYGRPSLGHLDPPWPRQRLEPHA
jgi:hypothetical protein